MEKRIMEYIRKEVPVEKICHDLRLSLRDFNKYLNNIQNSGTTLFQDIKANGDIMFSLSKTKDDDAAVYLTCKDGEYIIAASSDYHVGSSYDNLKRIDILQNFFVDNSIDAHVNLGDNVNGFPKSFANVPGNEKSMEKQIKRAVEVFPYIYGPNIVIIGDHDGKYKCDDGYSINKAFKTLRKDLKVYSNGMGILNINGVEFALCHDVNNPHVNKEMFTGRFVLSSHSHISKSKVTVPTSSLARFVIPSMSDLPTVNYRAPGFCLLRLSFNNKQLTRLCKELYVFYGTQMYHADTLEIDINKSIATSPVRKHK